MSKIIKLIYIHNDLENHISASFIKAALVWMSCGPAGRGFWGYSGYKDACCGCCPI